VKVVYWVDHGRVGIGLVVPQSMQKEPRLDPTTCYAEMLTLMPDGDSAAAREHALNLQHWLNRGGFCPKGHSLAEVKSQLSRALRVTDPVPQ
jgi:hypothetical protein